MKKEKKKKLSANWTQNKYVCVCVCVFTQSCPTPCDPIDYSLPIACQAPLFMGFSSAKIMEWVVGNDQICDIF